MRATCVSNPSFIHGYLMHLYILPRIPIYLYKIVKRTYSVLMEALGGMPTLDCFGLKLMVALG